MSGLARTRLVFSEPATTRLTANADEVPMWKYRPWRYRLGKRMLDLIVAMPLLILTAPIQALLALAIRLDSPGAALFKQRRLKADGGLFTFIKFRTMYVDAQTKFPELYDLSDIIECGGALPIKMEDDPRLTGLGKWLRRTSFDELPNLWNVVTGDISLVGPRPEIPELLPCYSARHKNILKVKPGVTGLPQISGRNRLTVEQTLDLDLVYAQEACLWLDLFILVKTPRSLLRRGDAF